MSGQANRHEPVVDVVGERHVVVGAASGLGRACARRLASLGASVACVDVDLDGARQVAKMIEADEGRADAFHVDVTSVESVVDTVARIHHQLGGIDALVNCAGVTGTTNILTHEVDPADFDHVYAVNLRGAFLLSRSVLPLMTGAGYGRLLHVASISGKDGNAGMAAYSSTKAGLIGLVKVLGKEYAATGVTINCLAPAVVQTPMVDALPAEQVRYMTDKIPMQRTCTLTEVADMVAWIVSPSCSFTTGFTFDLTGGRAVY